MREVLRSKIALELARELSKLSNSTILFQINFPLFNVEITFSPSSTSSGKVEYGNLLVYSQDPLSPEELNKVYREIAIRIKQLRRFIELFKEEEKEYLMYHSLESGEFASLPPLNKVEVFTNERIKKIESSLKELGPPPPFLRIERGIYDEKGNYKGLIIWERKIRPHDSIEIDFSPFFPGYQELDVIEKVGEEFKEEMKKIKEALKGGK